MDYISIVFETANAEDVIMHILGLPTDIFNVYPASVKFKTYQARWQIGDIYVSGDARKTEDNPQGLGCYLVMTGRGCDDIFRILDSRNYTFGDMFKHCERRYGLDNFHFTRLPPNSGFGFLPLSPKTRGNGKAPKYGELPPLPKGRGSHGFALVYLEFLTTATASAELTALSRFTSARRNFRTETFSKSVYLPL